MQQQKNPRGNAGRNIDVSRAKRTESGQAPAAPRRPMYDYEQDTDRAFSRPPQGTPRSGNSAPRSYGNGNAAHSSGGTAASGAAPQRRQAPQSRSAASPRPPRSAAQPVRPYANGRSAAPARAASSTRPAGRGASVQSGGRPRGAASRPRTTAATRAAAKRRARRWRIGLLSAVAVVALSVIAVRAYLGTLIKPGQSGEVSEEIKTPPQLAKSQINLLAVGIDYTEFDGAEIERDPIGQTDMILYLRFDLEANTLKMLQIPRDLFMGENAPTGGTGKINGLYKHGEETVNRIDNLAIPLSEALQLPIDGYVSINMVSLREIVDVFGGIEVYVATPHEHEGSSLNAGWQVLHGDMLEFFLRDRYSTATGDIGRLDNQRYFYSALFRRVRTATWQDIVKLTPVAQQYVNTDLSVTDCAAMGIRLLKIPSSNIMMCRLPTFDSTENFNSQAVQVVDVQGTTELLNEYFRTPETQIAAEAYSFADWPHADTPHVANVQWMNAVDADGGGTVGEGADAAQTGDDVLAPPVASSGEQNAA